MARVYIPARSADDWQSLLAEPELHWKTGRSARSLAHCWADADEWPDSFGQALTEAGLDLEILLAIPEHEVPLPGGSRPSQTDLWVLARSRADSSLASVAVEGKVSESFGPVVSDWLKDDQGGKTERLRYLCQTLGVREPTAIGSLRYQLLHRTASAVIEAGRFGAARAMMVVHSFSDQQVGFPDYVAFAQELGAEPAVGSMSRARDLGGVELWLGWVAGEPRYLTR